MIDECIWFLFATGHHIAHQQCVHNFHFKDTCTHLCCLIVSAHLTLNFQMAINHSTINCSAPLLPSVQLSPNSHSQVLCLVFDQLASIGFGTLAEQLQEICTITNEMWTMAINLNKSQHIWKPIFILTAQCRACAIPFQCLHCPQMIHRKLFCPSLHHTNECKVKLIKFRQCTLNDAK